MAEDNDVILGFTPTDAKRVAIATRWVERNGMRPPAESAPPGLTDPLGPLIYNDAGETIPAYSAVKQTGEDMAGNEVVIKVGKPDGTFGSYLLTGGKDIPAGECGRAQDSFRVQAAYSTGSPARGEAFGVKSGSFQLFKGYPPLVIVQKVRDSDRKILQGEFRPITTLVGKADSNIAAISSDVPGSGTVSIYYVDPADGKLKDSGMDVTGRNVAPQAVTAGAYIHLVPVNGFWCVEPLPATTTTPGARLVKGLLSGSLASSDATVGLTSVTAYDGGSVPGTITANNVLGLAAPNSSTAIAVLDAGSGEYDLINVMHVTRVIPSDVYLSGLDLKKDKKTLVTMDDNDDTDGVVIVEGDTCPGG